MATMRPRDPPQHHRVATPLELFFDLCFVVAVGQAAAQLHHGISGGHAAAAISGFAAAFFAIWWAWMNFTWFASAYDVDDVPYRLTSLLQIVGVLVLAAGVPKAFAGDFTVVTIGYAVMRCALIVQWLRAAHGDPRCRRTCVRYAVGIGLCQLAWLARLAFFTQAGMLGIVPLMVAELLVPIWAERAGSTGWHPHHIAERYGLLTLIVLGECVLSATLAIQAALTAGHSGGGLIAVVAGAPLVVFSMWWLYFGHGSHAPEVSDRGAYAWGYGHYLIFAATAAVGAGLGVQLDHHAAGHGHGIAGWIAGAAVAVPAAIYVLAVWALLVRTHETRRHRSLAFPVAAALVLATIATPWPVPLTGAILAALVGFTVVGGHPAPEP